MLGAEMANLIAPRLDSDRGSTIRSKANDRVPATNVTGRGSKPSNGRWPPPMQCTDRNHARGGGERGFEAAVAPHITMELGGSEALQEISLHRPGGPCPAEAQIRP
jgi:hypothetical protein